VSEFCFFLRPLQAAENSVLVDVLQFPDRLLHEEPRKKGNGNNHRGGGGVCSKLIQHSKLLLESRHEELCIRVLTTLCDMVTNSRTSFNEKVGWIGIYLLYFWCN
jgi:hypothetical protein